MGFSAFLMGEAAAKNPNKAVEYTKAFESANLDANGKAWLEYSSRALSSERTGKPFVKICGITNVDDASLACELGADFLGFIMWKKSGRNVEKERIAEIRKALDEKKLSCRVKFVGVVVDLDSAEGKNALELCENGVLDFVQVHTFDSAVKFVSVKKLSHIPHYCAVNVASESDLEKLAALNRLGEPRILIDAQSATGVGGTGKTIDSNLVRAVKKSYRLWLAGGISPDNVSEIVGEYSPELLDVSSSLEKEIGVKDHEKMKKFFFNLNKIRG
jgi:indole-3-glycerol phosphate synthase/phosphoribosylanthranilate isomerase